MIEEWLDQFLDNPQKSISHLFSGRAGLGTYMRLDTPEFLYLVFTGPDVNTDHVSRLDEALLDWLVAMKRDYATQVKSLGFNIYSKRICDALTTINLMGLSHAREEIRNDIDAWLRDLAPLRFGSDRDPALDCWRLLTAGQLKNANPTVWLKLASDPRAEYLRVALLGLANIPYSHDTRQNQIWLVIAILTHAVIRFGDPNGAKSWFNREMAALRGRYPRSPQHWKTIIHDAIRDFTPNLANNSLHLNQFISLLEPDARTERSFQSMVKPAPMTSILELRSDILGYSTDTSKLAERLFAILEQNYVYAIRTGQSDYFVKTLDNLGRKLLRRGGLGPNQISMFGVLIEQAIGFQPANDFCWGLLAEWYYHQEKDEQCEWVLREAVRLFPGNVICLNELALHLIDLGVEKYDEAECLLQKSIQEDPSDSHSFMSLISLLLTRGGTRDLDVAEDLLRTRLVTNSNDKYVILRLAKLLARRQDGDKLNESERLLKSYISGHPSDEDFVVTLAKLLMYRGTEQSAIEAEMLLIEDVQLNPHHEQSLVALSKLLLSKGDFFFAEAVSILVGLIRRNLDDSDPHIQLSRLLYEIGESAKAVEVLSDYHGMQADPIHVQRVSDDLGAEQCLAKDDVWFSDTLIPESISATRQGVYGRSIASRALDEKDIVEKPNGWHDTAGESCASLLKSLPQPNLERHNNAIDELARRTMISSLLKELRKKIIDPQSSSFQQLADLAASGDQLAGLYLQYIDPATTIDPPPGAWAWKACRAWQAESEQPYWMAMLKGFPQAKIELSALMLLRKPTAEGSESIRRSYSHTTQDKPVGQFIRKLSASDGIQSLPESLRYEQAFEILSSAALSPVIFST